MSEADDRGLMMSVTVQQAFKKLQSYAWTAEDFRPYEWVLVQQRRGHQLYAASFAQEWGDWYFVFTEHDGYYFFHKEDVSIIQFSQQLGGLVDRTPVLGLSTAQLERGRQLKRGHGMRDHSMAELKRVVKKRKLKRELGRQHKSGERQRKERRERKRRARKT